MKIAPTPRLIEIDKLKVAALEWGPSDGEPILAFHGWLDNAASYSKLVPPLLEKKPNLRIIAVDFPGHGHSEHKVNGPYHFIDAIAEALEIADGLGWEKFSLLGHSLGAGVSSMVAGAFPDRVKRCALIEGLGPLVDKDENAAQRFIDSIQRASIQTRSRKRGYPNIEEASKRLADATGMNEESAYTLCERALVEGKQGWVWRADPRLRIPSRLRLTETQVQSFLKRISCPTLLIRARPGYDFSDENIQRRAALVKDIQYLEVSGSHHPHLDSPQEIANILADFFA